MSNKYYIGDIKTQESLLRNQIAAMNARASLAHQPLVDAIDCVARLHKRISKHFNLHLQTGYPYGFNKTRENARRLRQMQRKEG